MNINKKDIHKMIGEEVESLLLEIATGQDRGFLRNLAQYGRSSDEKRRRLRQARQTGAATRATSREDPGVVEPIKGETRNYVDKSKLPANLKNKWNYDDLGKMDLNTLIKLGRKYLGYGDKTEKKIRELSLDPSYVDGRYSTGQIDRARKRQILTIVRDLTASPRAEAEDAGSTPSPSGDPSSGSTSSTSDRTVSDLDPSQFRYGSPGKDLKSIQPAKAQAILRRLASKGFTAKTVAKQIDDALKKLKEPGGLSAGSATNLRRTGSASGKMFKGDEEVIKQVKKEVVKILSGDFSGLKENKEILYVHPITYKILNSFFEECK